MEIELIRKHDRLAWPQLLIDEADASQALDPVRVIVLGDQFRPLPDPADLAKPAPHGLGRNRDAPRGLPRQGQRGTTPTRTAPPIRPGSSLEQRYERPAPRWEQHRGAQGWKKPPVGVVFPAQSALAIGAYRTVYAGARAEEDHGNVRRGTTSRAQQQNMEGQQIAVPCTPQRGQYLPVLLRGKFHEGALGHSRGSSIHGCVATSDVS